MKNIILGSITLIAILLIFKALLALTLVDINQGTQASTPEISQDTLLKMGKQTYLVYCASCHGSDGKGNHKKAQDHTSRMSKASIEHVINHGSNHFTSLYPSGMPAGLISKKDVQKVADYLSKGMRGERPKAWSTCASCHDENGEGIPFIAPNIKVYGDELVKTVLKHGKKGILGRMPSFEGRLSNLQMNALATYIRSLEHQ